MAVIWTANVEGNRYEVRSAGASLRLYRNGVHHSQWNPSRPLSGSIWDLFAVPMLHQRGGESRDALFLGFGAGAAGLIYEALGLVGQITGVELDPMHLSVADGFFECGDHFDLIAGDAVEFVMSSQGEKPAFDIVVDDLYSEEQGLPQRCAPLDSEWFRALASMTRPCGTILLNILEPEKVRALPPFREADLRDRFPHAMVCSIDGYENRVVAFSGRSFERPLFKKQLAEAVRQFPRCRGVAERYRLRNLAPSSRDLSQT